MAEPEGRSNLAQVAFVIAVLALASSSVQGYFSWRAYQQTSDSTRFAAAPGEQIEAQPDVRTNVTISELAKRAPSIHTGTLQAWWAGEQARQVQRLEALAKRQALAGDQAGAARSVSRADAIRNGIPALANSDRPPAP